MGQEVSTRNRVYFLSDAHFRFNDRGSERERKLLGLFEEIQAYGTHLYIVGDLFDFWFEYNHAIPAAYLGVIAGLYDLTRSGVKVIYLPGNHDFWMKDYLSREAGVQLVGDTFEAIHFGKKIFLIHGDGLRKDDKGYRMLKRIFRNKVCIWLYSQVPVNLAYRLAMGTSHASREYTTNRKKSDPTDYIEYARQKVSEGYDAVVMGHVHLPQIEDLGNGLYINTGDFFEHYSYVVMAEGGLELCRK